MVSAKLNQFINHLLFNSIEGSPGLNCKFLLLIVTGTYLFLDIIGLANPLYPKQWEWVTVDGLGTICILLCVLWNNKIASCKTFVGITLSIVIIIVYDESNFFIPENTNAFIINSFITEVLNIFLYNDTIPSIFKAIALHLLYYAYAIFTIIYRVTTDLKLYNTLSLIALQTMILLTTVCSTYYIMSLRAQYLRSLHTHKKIMKNWQRIMNYIELGISIEHQGAIQFRNHIFYNYFQSSFPLSQDKFLSNIKVREAYKFTYENKSYQISKQYVQFNPYSTEKSEMYIISDVTGITKFEQDKYTQMLIATITHELRTPLNIISAILNNIQDQIKKKPILTEISKAMCAVTLQECLINDVMDVAKIYNEQLKITMSPSYIRKAIVEMYSLFKFKVDEKISFKLDLDDQVPDKLLIDERRYKQIVLNLLSNSSKFTKQGCIHMLIKYDGQYLITSVIDTGIGISEQNRDKIFKKFGMVDEVRAINQSGSGLGLNLCKHLVESMDGSISFDSKQNIRTEFKFTIKCDEVKDDESKLVSINNILVIVIDDDLLNLSVISSFAKKCDLKCKIYQHSSDAVKIKETQSCIYFIDLHMPEVDGFDCAKILRDQYKLKKDVFLVALTGDELDSVQSLCISSGFREILTKPLKYDMFRECIEKYCSILTKP